MQYWLCKQRNMLFGRFQSSQPINFLCSSTCGIPTPNVPPTMYASLCYASTFKQTMDFHIVSGQTYLLDKGFQLAVQRKTYQKVPRHKSWPATFICFGLIPYVSVLLFFLPSLISQNKEISHYICNYAFLYLSPTPNK